MCSESWQARKGWKWAPFLPLRQGRDSPWCCFPAYYLFIYLFDIQVCLIYCCSRRHSADFNTVGSCWPQHGPTAGVQGFELAPASPESGHSEDTGMALPHVFRLSFPSAIFPDDHTSSQLLPLLRHDLSDQFGVESGPGQASECLGPLLRYGLLGPPPKTGMQQG